MSDTSHLTDSQLYMPEKETVSITHDAISDGSSHGCFPFEVLLCQVRNLALPCIDALLNAILASTGVNAFSTRQNELQAMGRKGGLTRV